MPSAASSTKTTIRARVKEFGVPPIHDALVVVLDGRAEISVSGRTQVVAPGEAILLPGGVPHAVAAPERFTMLLVMLKNG